jgi:hypothetical protein
MEKKINLEEIIRESIIEYLTPKLQNPGQALGIANRIIEKEWYEKRAMLKFGKQLLELAAENAKTKYDENSYCGNTGSEYEPDIIVDKQSILDTLNQVE